MIALYNDHGTSESFRSEFKNDLDLERLPADKLETNALLMSMTSLLYNILRSIGLFGLMGKDGPVRHPAKRCRLKTVVQDLLCVWSRAAG